MPSPFNPPFLSFVEEAFPMASRPINKYKLASALLPIAALPLWSTVAARPAYLLQSIVRSLPHYSAVVQKPPSMDHGSPAGHFWLLSQKLLYRASSHFPFFIFLFIYLFLNRLGLAGSVRTSLTFVACLLFLLIVISNDIFSG